MDHRIFSGLNLLIVDDEEFVLNLSVRILKKIGCEKVTTVNNGRLAIDRIVTSKSAYDIVITDLNMPGMDGVELLRHIAGNNYLGGIILLSGEDERMLQTALDLARSQNLNVLGAIPKPLKPDELSKLLGQFEPAVRKENPVPQESITLEELIQGLDGDALQLVYHPKVDIRNSAITGVEVLARWMHKERGLLGPNTFIPLAEDNGFTDGLAYAVYRKAMHQAGVWLASGIDLDISINFSVNSFMLPHFPDFLISTALDEGVNPDRIILEVSENQVISDEIECLEKMMQLRLKKFGLSIDDFGTGRSSMTQLKRVPFTELKIDRGFVSGVANDSSARAILESSITLGRKLNMSIVAEGVETREDWELIKEIGCDYIQGFYVSRPMAGDRVAQFTKQWAAPHG